MLKNKYKNVIDESGTFIKATKVLPEELFGKFLAAVAEIENTENHATRNFPISNLRMIHAKNSKNYRGSLGKGNAFRFLAYLGPNNTLYLTDVLKENEHDRQPKTYCKKTRNRKR